MLSLLKPRAFAGCTRSMSTTALAEITAAAVAPAPNMVQRSRFINLPPADDPLLHYFASRLHRHGHRARANDQLSKTLVWIHALTRAPPLPILREAVFAASPAVRSMSQTRGAKRVSIPAPLNEKQRTRYGVQHILEAVAIAKARKQKFGRHQPLEERLAREIIGLVQGHGFAITKKEEIHKLAMVNRGNVMS